MAEGAHVGSSLFRASSVKVCHRPLSRADPRGCKWGGGLEGSVEALSPLCAWAVGLPPAYSQGCRAAQDSSLATGAARSRVYCLVFCLLVVLPEQGGFLLKLPICTLPSNPGGPGLFCLFERSTSLGPRRGDSAGFFLHAASGRRMQEPPPQTPGHLRRPSSAAQAPADLPSAAAPQSCPLT